MRKERALLQLRSEIAHEQQLIDQARQRLLNTQSRLSTAESPRDDPPRLALAQPVARRTSGPSSRDSPAQPQPNTRLANGRSYVTPAPTQHAARTAGDQPRPPSSTPWQLPAKPTNVQSPSYSSVQPTARTTNEQSLPSPVSRIPAVGARNEQLPPSPSASRPSAARPMNGELHHVKQYDSEAPSTTDGDSHTDNEFENNVIKREDSGGDAIRNTLAQDVPPALTARQLLQGRTRKDFHIFMTYLQSHFRIHGEYFRPDHRKLGEAYRHLPGDIHERWMTQMRSRAHPPTWAEFCDFLRSQVRSTIPAELALHRYKIARQKPLQTVRNFNNYLANLETQLDELVTDQMRFERLYEGVPEAVQEAAGPRRSGMTYDDYVNVLHEAEKRVPKSSKRRRID